METLPMARQFERPAPGNRYTAAERRAWGAAQGVKPTPAKRASRSKTLVADTSGSTCFDSLTYKDGTVTASFIGPAAGVYEYDVTLAEAREWFADPSLGSYFNSEIK